MANRNNDAGWMYNAHYYAQKLRDQNVSAALADYKGQYLTAAKSGNTTWMNNAAQAVIDLGGTLPAIPSSGKSNSGGAVTPSWAVDGMVVPVFTSGTLNQSSSSSGQNKTNSTNASSLRPPDYASLSVGVGIPQYGGQIQISEDTYGGWYIGAGRSWNQKGASITGSAGYINQSNAPTPEQCIQFNSGQSVVVETSCPGGVAVTQSLNSSMNGTAGIFSWIPQADVTIYHSVYLGNPRQYVANFANKYFN